MVEQLADVIDRRGLPSDYYANGTCPLGLSEETYREMRNGLAILRAAAIYAHRIDYLLSGDDGEETFLKRLKEELANMRAISTCAHAQWMVEDANQYVDICLNHLTEEEFDAAARSGPSHILIVADAQ